MKVLFFIVIILFFIWMGYDLIFNKNQPNESKYQEVLKKIDKGDKWYYYKMKLKVFGIILVVATIGFIIWLIIKVINGY